MPNANHSRNELCYRTCDLLLVTYFWLLNYFRGLTSGAILGRLLVLWSHENKEMLAGV